MIEKTFHTKQAITSAEGDGLHGEYKIIHKFEFEKEVFYVIKDHDGVNSKMRVLSSYYLTPEWVTIK